MKRDNWNKLYNIWENPETVQQPENEVESVIEREVQPAIKRLSKLMAKWKRPIAEETEKAIVQEKNEYADLPETEEALKQYFLDKLFNFQMNWATSTVTETSIVNSDYYQNSLLKYLLQRFPDTYLIMYLPVFTIKKAPVETEIMLISPIGIEIIHYIEKDSSVVIMAGDERTWTLVNGKEHTKVLSPLIALKRSEKLVNSILVKNKIDFPIKKTVLSRTNSIVYATEPYHTKIIGQQDYPDWFHEKRRLSSPLKNAQLKVAEALLKNCQTTSIKRPEWETNREKDIFRDMGE
ncbi:NERD domain-containing protein [Oceanobacillus rekensis]|uniref:NERD domain-containing protein n=1 Tax=Oceanobacillus rekensis TaxID=937927 RepID=UPI001FE4AFBD|nr:NERD domain-containing protein [Oceanobacillus rekensis]